MTIVGLQHVKYRSGRTGRDVEGFRFHLLDEDPGVEGLIGASVETVFVSDAQSRIYLRNFAKDSDCLGENVRVIYNRFGRAEELEPLVVEHDE